MKLLSWLVISWLIIWEMNHFEKIFGISVFTKYILIVGLIIYFGYLFDIHKELEKIKQKFLNKGCVKQ
ncbi:MAG: hypothetical protein GX972_01675 [Amphibacillus sp.]|nr:hypothetical protein [Amphibacillus sp.]